MSGKFARQFMPVKAVSCHQHRLFVVQGERLASDDLAIQSVGLICLLVVSCYANSLQNAFHYDDIHSILENDSIT